MTELEIFDRASSKAMAQIHHLRLSIRQNKEDIKLGITGALTDEQLRSMLVGEEKELKVWQFISELIEKSNLHAKYDH